MMKRAAYAAALLTVFTLALLAFPVSAFAGDNYIVSDWRSLQDAIDDSEEGDVLIIGRTLTPAVDDSYIHIPSNKQAGSLSGKA
ncbi:MAG: hypothetical protein IKF07_04970 [Eubacterium sp.]|nr:hypothetical protein [Eubacterium sp.]